MANNLGVSTGADATVKTTETAGVHVPHHNVDTIANSVAVTSTVLGDKTDARSTATDATSVSAMQVLKQISESTQGIAGVVVVTGQDSMTNSIPVTVAGSII